MFKYGLGIWREEKEYLKAEMMEWIVAKEDFM